MDVFYDSGNIYLLEESQSI